MTESVGYDPSILGGILLLQSAIAAQPDDRRMAELLASGLTRVPGISGAALCKDGCVIGASNMELPSSTAPPSADEEHPSGCGRARPEHVQLALATARRAFGWLVLGVADTDAFSLYRPFIENTAGMAALMMDNREQEARLQEVNRNLEDLIADRTAELRKEIDERKRAEAALKASEVWYRSLFDQSPEGIFMHDLDGRILDANRQACEQSGYSRDELLQMTVFDLHPPSSFVNLSRDEIRQRWAEWRPSERSKVNAEHVRKDGFVYPAEISTGLIRCGDQDLMLALVEDVTERERLYATLEANYRLLRIAGDAARLGGWSVDLADNTSIWSDEVADIHEVPRGSTPTVEEGIAFYAPEWRERIAQVFNDCAQNGIPYDEEMEIITSTGRRVWVRTVGEAVRDAGGRIVQVHGAFQDISARKHADAALIESEDRFRSLFENMASGCCIDELVYENGKAVDYRILDVNPAFERIIGCPREKLVGSTASKVYGTSSIPFFDAYTRVAETGDPESFEAFFAPAGKHLHITASCPRRGRFSTVFTDITERVRSQQLIAEQLDELTRWHEVMLGREERVQELKREVNELCSRVGEPARYPSQGGDTSGQDSR